MVAGRVVAHRWLVGKRTNTCDGHFIPQSIRTQTITPKRRAGKTTALLKGTCDCKLTVNLKAV